MECAHDLAVIAFDGMLWPHYTGRDAEDDYDEIVDRLTSAPRFVIQDRAVVVAAARERANDATWQQVVRDRRYRLATLDQKYGILLTSAVVLGSKVWQVLDLLEDQHA